MTETVTAPPTSGETVSTLPDPQPPAPPAPPAVVDDDITTADDWANAGHHKVWTYTGRRILIRIPDLFTLIQEDAIPERLRGVALREIETGSPTGSRDTDNGPGIDWDTVKRAAEFYEHVSFNMIIRPQITLEQFRGFPAEDRDMLRQIAMRERNRDARGVLLGVEPFDRLTVWREKHGCADVCPACDAALADLSSLGRA